jgi:UDP-N-acetylmuramyl pentapeptide phosphotransferase/UDP-N-acetylglucosamine-1-phosphate transferase
MNHDPLREGRQPWDPANGLRVGVMMGALIGAGLFIVSGRSTLWLIVVSAAVGGGIGFWSEKRKQPKR